MRLFLFLGARRGHAILAPLLAMQEKIAGILCLVEDTHEYPWHLEITAVAKAHDIPIFYSHARLDSLDEIKQVTVQEYPKLLRQIEPDLALVIGWRYLIPQEAYEIPLKGTFVIHDSLLPRYRGFAPMNWAIINGETETGVTLFVMAKDVDSGAIVDQMTLPILPNDTAKTIDDQMILLYQKILVKNLPHLAHSSARFIPQNEHLATYTCKRIPSDGQIDWNKSATEIHNLIRGLTQPFPGAYTFLNGKKLFIWESALPEQSRKYVGNIPGRIIGKFSGMIEVLTGQGVLRLKRLQYEKEAEQASQTFVISVKDTLGRTV